MISIAKQASKMPINLSARPIIAILEFAQINDATIDISQLHFIKKNAEL
jgi:hypothetical protein